ncbi:MAG: PAS domain-containing protein [Sedimentisphaerales bacterium]|nr:PAS domain-containing protein [Sedimentisphaerales bacterium]
MRKERRKTKVSCPSVKHSDSVHSNNHASKIEQILRQSKQQYRTTIDALDSAIHVVDRDLRVVLINATMQNWLKRFELRTDPVGMMLFEVFPFLSKRVLQEYRQVFETGQPENTLETTRVGGCEIITDTRKIPVFEDGHVVRIVTVMHDITAQKKTEKALQFANDQMQKYLDIAEVILVVLDAEGKVSMINRKGGEILGYDLSEIEGRNWFETFLPVSDRQRTRESFDQLMQGELGPESFENPVLTRSGAERLITWHNTIMRDTEGNIIGTLSSGEDITDRRQAEKERDRLLRSLENKNEELRSIVYVASHDMRSPLVNVQGFAGELQKACQQVRELLAAGSLSPDQQEILRHLLEQEIPEDLRFILAGSEKLDILVGGLLHLSRVGTMAMDIELLDMNDMFGRILRSLHFQIQQIGAVVRLEKVPPCRGDYRMVNQIFSNLIDNAIKYRHAERSCSIDISGVLQNEHIVYSVSDNGVGIEPQHHQKVFEIFHRLHPDGPVKGEGLGLTIIKRILDRLDGFVELQSELEKGTTFIVGLPTP